LSHTVFHDRAPARLAVLPSVHLGTGKDIFEGALGAYKNLLRLAQDEAEYCRMVMETFRNMNLEVQGNEDVKRVELPILGEDLRTLVDELSETSPVVYDTFYIYESEAE